MRNVFVLPLVIILQAALFPQTRQGAAPQTVAFMRVTVIDPASAAVRRDLTVVITGNLISALGKTGEVAMPKGAQVVDVTGKFMIPGLWDMHAHFAYEAGDVEQIYFPLQVVNGVTGVRDMGSVGHPIERIKEWHCPTLVVNRQYALREKPEIILNDPRARYIPLSQLHIWWLFTEAERSYSADWFAAERRRDELHLRMVKLLHRAGVGILAGADATGYPFPGFSLHDELALFVKAGLTPLDALRTATSNPAKYLGLLDSLGAIEPGKLADLALLDADPLEEISNTKRIHAVMVNGRYLPKERLQELLTEIEAAADKR